MLNDLTRLLIRANEDRDVRCVILTGNGRAFCAGLDLEERNGDGLSAASSATSLDLRNTPPTVLQAMDKPTICAVNGGAAGYGMDTAPGCDIRIMAESAKLAAAFVKCGVVPESGGTWFLPRMIGWAKPSELIFTGRTLAAREALEWGLGNEVVLDATLMGRAREVAREIAANAPLAVQAAKRMMRMGAQRNLPRSRASRLSAASAAVQDARHAGRHQGVHGEARAEIRGTVIAACSIRLPHSRSPAGW
jgi:enoyl-CoA hydratase/carnithine racemase